MFRRILVPLDGSAVGACGLPHAATIARSFPGSVVVLLRVAESKRGQDDRLDSVDWRIARADACAYLESTAKELGDQGLPVETRVAVGRASEQILEMTRREHVDLLVLCSHGRGGITDFALAGTAHKAISRSSTSILLVRAREEEAPAVGPLRYGKILVPLDGSQRADWALQVAACIARSHGAELLLVHVVSEPGSWGPTALERPDPELERRWIEANVDAARNHMARVEKGLASERLRLRTRVLVASHVARTLEEIAKEEDVDLIVVSAHGRSPGPGWPYGSVTASLLAEGTKPILVFQDVRVSSTERPDARETETWRSRPERLLSAPTESS